MPTSLRTGPYRFFFYSGDHSEPIHIHVERDNDEAKFWLDPVRLAYNKGFLSSELRTIEKITEEYEEHLMNFWNEYFDYNN